MPRSIAFDRRALAACSAAFVSLCACHIDHSPGPAPAVQLRDSTSREAATDSGTTDEGGAGDAGGPSVGARVRYEVPAAGGMVTVTAGSGHPIAFRFPPSAGGLSIVLTPVATSVLGWPAAQFSDAVQMEPEGQQFDEPILVTPSSGDVLLMTLASSDHAPEGLPFDAKRKAFELRHFSTLVVVAPESSCGSASGWHAQREAAQCEGFGSARSYVEFTCTANPLCQQINTHCCAPASAQLCRLGNPNLVVSYSAQGKANDMFPSCRGASAADASTRADSKLDAGGHTPDSGSPSDNDAGAP